MCKYADVKMCRCEKLDVRCAFVILSGAEGVRRECEA